MKSAAASDQDRCAGIVTTHLFNASKYFVTKPGLYVTDGFTAQVISAYPEVVASRGLEGVKTFRIRRTLHGPQLLDFSDGGEKHDLKKYPFAPDQIATLLDLQPGGVAGQLCTEQTNVFCLVGKDKELFAVSVYWLGTVNSWHVQTLALTHRNGHLVCVWNPGMQVFYNTQKF